MSIDGWVAPGFENVREAFTKNIESGADLGAAFTAYHHGQPIVDLWGGVADEATGRAWDEHTMVIVYSTTKGATAICAHQLAQEGALDLDAPVAKYWPEFAQAGKDDVPVSYLLSHQAGLAWVDEELTLDEVLAWEPIVDALARQKPLWEPGTAHGYHAVTYGNLVGEVVRRVSGRSLGTYFRDEVAAPLGLDFHIGLAPEHEPRVATLVGTLGPLVGRTARESASPADAEMAKLMNEFMGLETKAGKALTLNGAFGRAGDADPRNGNVFNLPAVHAAEIPAANGICDARSLARMYAACIGDVDGVRVLSEATMRNAAKQRTVGPNTVLFDLDLQFGLGFFVRSTIIDLGGPNSFGHAGAGGSLGWADPDAGLAFGYVMNRMGFGVAGDDRSGALIRACYEALA
jgi:CubicO group peptidase (beta-lactamase class C family)